MAQIEDSAATGAGLRKPRADEIDVYGLTHGGLVRPSNQDHFLVGTLGDRLDVHLTSLPGVPTVNVPAERHAFLAMVADGVGSSIHGEEASRLTVEGIALYVAESVLTYYTRDTADEAAFTQALENAALRCHAELRRKAGADDTRHGMATTLTLWLGVWPRAYLLQVGDSRYYLYRDGRLSQVSRDQTVAQELIDQGVLTPTVAYATRWAHVLSSAIGGVQTLPLVTAVQNDWSSVHLLCSDGLTKHVSDEHIAARLAGMTSARSACEALLQDALDAGGTDNVTIIIGRAIAAAGDRDG